MFNVNGILSTNPALGQFAAGSLFASATGQNTRQADFEVEAAEQEETEMQEMEAMEAERLDLNRSVFERNQTGILGGLDLAA